MDNEIQPWGWGLAVATIGDLSNQIGHLSLDHSPKDSIIYILQ